MNGTITSVATRSSTPSDDEVLRAIFRSTRQAEFELAGLPPAAIAALCDQQFDLQQAHYRWTFDHLDHQVVLGDGGDVIGQIAVDHGPDSTTIVDIGFLPDHRGRGIGSRVLGQVIASAERRGVPTVLTVDRTNRRAEALYRRLGFAPTSSTELHLHLRRNPTGKEPE